MAIQVGLSDGIVSLKGTGSNTTLHTNTNRSQVGAHNLQNNASVEVQVSIYRSPDDSSASGNLIETILIASGKNKDVLSTIGLGLVAGEYLVAVVETSSITLGEVLSNLTYTQFTEGS